MSATSLTSLAECFAWCMLQVTLFAAAALCVYGLVRREMPERNVLLLAGSLGLVGLMTLAFVSPWPRWKFIDRSSCRRPLLDNGHYRYARMTFRLKAPRRLWVARQKRPVAGRRQQEPAKPRPSSRFKDVIRRNLRCAVASQTMIAASRLAVVAIPDRRRLVTGGNRHRAIPRRASLPALLPPAKHSDRRSRILDEFHALAHELHIVPSVALVEVPALDVAATIGWRRPLVVLPASWRDWTVDQRRAVLAHELAHVAQRHFPLWLVGQLAVAAHFYHPLVHWLGRRLRLEQELAADRLAVGVFRWPRRYTQNPSPASTRFVARNWNCLC